MTFTSQSENPAIAARTFTSFSQAAAEAGISRIYGGIHWDFDNTEGLATGKLVGQYVLAHVLRPVNQVHMPSAAQPAVSPPSVFNSEKLIADRMLFDGEWDPNVFLR